MFDERELEVGKIEIKEEELPTVVSEQFEMIKKTDKKIKEAQEKCEEAKEKAQKMKPAVFGKNICAINETQDVVKSLIVSQESLANAQKYLFDNQQKMAEAIRYLLVLGATSISMSRLVTKELELKLRKASEEELSKETRKELIGVIKLLKEQESQYSKQNRIDNELHETIDIVSVHEEKIISIEETSDYQSQKIKDHECSLGKIEEKNILQDKKIYEAEEINKQQEKIIDEILKKDEDQDFRLKMQKKLDKKQNKRIKKSNAFSLFSFLFSCISLGLVLIAIIIGIIGIVV